MTDLAAFILARIAEDEATARAAADAAAPGSLAFSLNVMTVMGPGRYDHAQRWDPVRVLAECEAKRRIVELLQSGANACDTCGAPYPFHDDYCGGYPGDDTRTLELLAMPYSGHPEFREEWRCE